jgi:hypothetical protein
VTAQSAVDGTRALRAATKRERADIAGMMEALANKAEVVARLRASMGVKSDELEERAATLFHLLEGKTESVSSTTRTPVEQARAGQLVLVAAAAFVSGLVVGRALMRRR